MRERLPVVEAVLERDGYFPTNHACDQSASTPRFPGATGNRPPTPTWRPAFGINPQASMVQWHGPKPRHVEKTLASGVTSAPLDAMRWLLKAYRRFLHDFQAALNDA
jgi:hypothetical protein